MTDAAEPGPTAPQGTVLAQGASLGDLADELATVADPHLRQRARVFASALLDAHGAGIARLLELVQDRAGEAAGDVLQAALDDPLVSSLLVLHDLHPDPVTIRVARAVDQAVSQLGPVGRHVAFVEVDGDVARVRVSGPAASPQARVGIEALLTRTLRTHAPDVDRLALVGEGNEARGGRSLLPMLST